MSLIDPPRRYLLDLIAERRTDMKTVSLQLKRNHAYLQQYVKAHKPSDLPEDVRDALGDLFGVEPDSFRGKGKVRTTTIGGVTTTPIDPAGITTKVIASTGTTHPKESLRIVELDVRPQAGPGGLPDFTEGETEHPIVDEWSIPKRYLDSYLPDTGRLTVIPVLGNSMEPDFLAGERVLVDTSHRTPSPDGVYVLWDGLGLVIKQVQLIPRSDPPRLRLISVNKTYDTYEILIADAEINGRVVGKWVWK